MSDNQPGKQEIAHPIQGDSLQQSTANGSQHLHDQPPHSATVTPLQAENPSADALTTPPAQEQSDRTGLISQAQSSQTVQRGLPLVPPRTYPQPPPSYLPNLLLGLARIFTWITGSSAALIFIYYRFILPRINRTYEARQMLVRHQSQLISRLTDSVKALKAEQESSYADLPRPAHPAEDARFLRFKTLEELVGAETDPDRIPDEVLLRCAIEELAASREGGVTTEELFQHLETKISWLQGEEGAQRQNMLWHTLSTTSVFVSSPSTPPPPSTSPSLTAASPTQLSWTYASPQSYTSSLLPALSTLKNSLQLYRAIPSMAKTASQNALQTMSDFTGYITTQTYTLNLPIRGGFSTSSGPGMGAEEDELRREIRALKGLVLNRRSFLGPGVGASVSRPPSAPTLSGLSNVTP